jgi:hypothetical protein
VIGFTGGFLGALAGVFSVDIRRADPVALGPVFFPPG